MNHTHSTSVVCAWILIGFVVARMSFAQVVTIDASVPPRAPSANGFVMGTSTNPAGDSITVTSRSLLRNGKPWLPVMGEYHYSRTSPAEWRDELLKMKAGGIDIVATYVFWIHHEEEKGVWDWSGARSLRDFVKTCQEVGMPVIVRCGPWCHGEVRNGGLPDWVAAMGRRVRTDDPEYVGYAKNLYQQISDQIKGMLWKDGGPVVGVQLENEFRNPTHLMTLKRLAMEVGLDTPLYTRTGWPALSGPLEFGQILPLYGAYSEGFWDRTVDAMPGNYWQAFTFLDERTDNAVGTDVLGERQDRDAADVKQYPYLTCELGGGMMPSYHRRVLIYPKDVTAVVLAKVGSGSNLPGYYMYHGGTNPDGKHSTLMESQNTVMTNYNDMPVKNYDFQAPLGEFGQVRPSYHMLRRFHLFLRDWGSELALMPAHVPAGRQQKNDAETLRYSVRSDGKSGFIFVNNYQRLLPMPAKSGVQFELKLMDQTLRVPEKPVTLAADEYFVWPFNLNLGATNLIYGTVQPICMNEEDGTTYYYFAQTPGVASEFVFDAKEGVSVDSSAGEISRADGRVRVHVTQTGIEPAIKIKGANGKSAAIVLLDEAGSYDLWKGTVAGKARVFSSKLNLIFDGDAVRARGNAQQPGTVVSLPLKDQAVNRSSRPAGEAVKVTLEKVKEAGPVREIKNGVQRVPVQPTDDEFSQAAVWRVKFPAGIDPSRDLTLRLKYVGDVARITLNGKLLTDSFYLGKPWEIGLKRFGPDIYTGEVLIQILPLQKTAPFYLAPEARPAFGEESSLATIDDAIVSEVVEHRFVGF